MRDGCKRAAKELARTGAKIGRVFTAQCRRYDPISALINLTRFAHGRRDLANAVKRLSS